VTASTGSAGWSVPRRQCVLCGDTGYHVAHGLIRRRGGDPFGSGPRCDDPAACWQRVMDQGEEWPAADGQPIRPPAQPSELPASSQLLPDREIGPTSAVEELDFGTAPEGTT
jgi:hypothetical protein